MKKIFEFIDRIGSRISSYGYLRYYKLKEGDVVVDCGAYFGQFALYCARKVGSSGLVVAFEPDEKVFEILEKKVKNSGLKNIILLKIALYNDYVKVGFKRRFMFSAVSSKGNLDLVQASTLDYELYKLGVTKVDFLKMDIEGAELEAFDGFKRFLSLTKNMAIACYHIRNGKITGRILKPMLQKLGFISEIGFYPHLTLYARNILL